MIHRAVWPKKVTRWLEGRTLHASVPFTWCIPDLIEEIKAPSLCWDSVLVGGPAVSIMPEMFDGLKNVTIGKESPGVLQRVNPLATKTTTGCLRSCKFCGIGEGYIEPGGIKELPDWPDLPILTDNNLLGASIEHFDKVIDRLKVWGWCDFNQGLDTRLLTPYHAKRIAEIKSPLVKVALDDMKYASKWEEACKLLLSVGLHKHNIRTLVLIGFNDTPEEAWDKLKYVKSRGQNPRPMWFHELNALDVRIVTPKQLAKGWTNAERVKITGWYYAGKGDESLPHVQATLAKKKYWFFNEVEV